MKGDTAPQKSSHEKSRPELTFAGNRDLHRHDWLRLTPAYSRKVVEDLLDDVPPDGVVLDPFSGSGTTALSAAQRGLCADGVELNPFLVWFGNAKLHRYAPRTLVRAEEACQRALRGTRSVCAPPIHNIERWWSSAVLRQLRRLAAGIRDESTGPVRDLLTVAFCRTLIEHSGAAFNHVSMSFKKPVTPKNAKRAVAARFEEHVRHVCRGAAHKPEGRARIFSGDARVLKPAGDAYDVVITSPPYPNRMSYVRELRPYMYWTGYLLRARDAGELDWEAIGGTWGIATSRLKDWKRSVGRAPKALAALLPKVRAASAKNGPVLATYLDRYFEDMHLHLHALRPKVRSGGTIHYIVGNSSFYGELVPVELLYCELMKKAGFRRPEVEVLRKRNSKKELYEFRVSAQG